jgi:hypothetical protein
MPIQREIRAIVEPFYLEWSTRAFKKEYGRLPA